MEALGSALPRQARASEMAIVSGIAIDRPPQIQPLDDRVRSEVELVAHEPLGAQRVPGAERLHVHRDRARASNGVRDLHLASVGEAFANDLSSNVPSEIGTAPVDLRWILPAERATAVVRGAAVCVDDDLATGHATVGRRTALDEAAGGIHENRQVLVMPLAEHVRYDGVREVLANG